MPNKIRKKILQNAGLPGSASGAQLNLKEDKANKATDFNTVNDTLYPSVQAVVNYVTASLLGLLDFRGLFDASTNTFPATGGSGGTGNILKADCWIVSVAGTPGGGAGTPVSVGDLIIALVDAPGQTGTNWSVLEGNLGYTPENIANKVTGWSTINNTVYPSVQAVDNQKMDRLVTINSQASSYTLVLSDNNKAIEFNSDTAVTLMVPKNAAVPFAIGSQIIAYQKGLGQITVTAQTGATVVSPGGRTKSSAQYSAISLLKTATDTWLLSGDIST